MLKEIQKHLDEIKLVFLSRDYDDNTMGWIVEDHIHAIQELLDKETKCQRTS